MSYKIDEPSDPAGEWWIDLNIDGTEVNVAWRSDKGFGIFSSGEDAYGASPDEIYRTPELAARRLMQLLRPTETTRKNSYMRLKDVRRLVDRPQTSVAERMHVRQSVISRLERQNDARLSTMSNYVESLGGKLKVVVCFEGFEAPIDMPESEEPAVGPGGRL